MFFIIDHHQFRATRTFKKEKKKSSKITAYTAIYFDQVCRFGVSLEIRGSETSQFLKFLTKVSRIV